MEQPTIVDYIIVGQGLAGSAVALQLLKRNKKIVVIDQPGENHSSRIAAGLFNPITGKKSVKTWMADTIYPYLHQFYSEIEKITGGKFFYPQTIYRPFASPADQNEWMGKSADPFYSDFIKDIKTSSLFEGVIDPYGGLILKGCGFLNTTEYLRVTGAYIRANGLIENGIFRPESLMLKENQVLYRQYAARKVLFCEGEKVIGNKWFNNLPIRPLKGETLTIKTGWHKDVILNRGVYMVPGGVPGQFRVGATYRFNDNSQGTTKEGRAEIEGKLKELIWLPYEVVGQDWGIRPTTVDRRPMLGRHPEFEQLVIFNGLGTKGVSLAPYFSDVLIRWLEDGAALSKEVDVTRFY